MVKYLKTRTQSSCNFGYVSHLLYATISTSYNLHKSLPHRIVIKITCVDTCKGLSYPTEQSVNLEMFYIDTIQFSSCQPHVATDNLKGD